MRKEPVHRSGSTLRFQPAAEIAVGRGLRTIATTSDSCSCELVLSSSTARCKCLLAT